MILGTINMIVVINISYGIFFVLSFYVNSATRNFMGVSRIPFKTEFHGEYT